MIQLEQIQRLQERVLLAVKRIDQLQKENTELKKQVEQAKDIANEYRGKLESHTEQYSKIEEGILHALDHLDNLEDSVAQQASPEPEIEEDAPAISPDSNHETRINPNRSENSILPTSDEIDYSPDYSSNSQESQTEPTEQSTKIESDEIETELDIF